MMCKVGIISLFQQFRVNTMTSKIYAKVHFLPTSACVPIEIIDIFEKK